MSNSIVLVGGGGHCKVVLDVIKENNYYDEIFISDLKENIGKEILDIRIKYVDEQLADLYNKGINFAFVSMGKININDQRMKLYKKIKNIGFKIPTIISKSSNVSIYTVISGGTFIGKNAIVNPGVKIGENCIINTGAIVEHDCIIGDNVHIGPGAVLSGGVKIGENSFIGTGVTIIQNTNIVGNTLIGAGAVVIKNIARSGVYVGNPAKEIRKE
ncbi:acetyltransferase [Petrotoga olearia]|uniref:Serine acetyltransferase n=2 Tax=Petrotoga olearia TaxID=156203 RepID=A0A2K1NZD2_9BACT|nr:acetyltransferase [Petrotoga olearia]PNR95886.1 serine acetyltransferase [Petrotoga olearia DSM 13574]RMA68754.1 sugar O-acyltransferase (sialic acid O-acetyltransferase NeuD family) [Petrotoga olearia]